MPIEIQNSYEQIDKESWDQIILQSEFASPFQTVDYYNFLKMDKEYDAEVFALADTGTIKALVVVTIMKEKGPKGYFSRRGIIFGGPVLIGNSQKDLGFLLMEVRNKLRGKAIYLESRNFFDYQDYKEVFNDAGWEYKPYYNIQLPVVGVSKKEILYLFKYSRRREIRQSISGGAIYNQSVNEKEIRSLYKILYDQYRTRVKKPIPTVNYFLGLVRSNILKAFIVKHEDRIIGGAFCPTLLGKGLYTYYYCGLRDYNSRIFPTHLAILAAIEYAVEREIPMVDFMGGGNPDSTYGVRQYKMEFGGNLVEHGRFILILNPFLFKVGELGLRIISRIS